MERTKNSYRLASALLIAMHIAGLIGLHHPVSRPLFEMLIPFNLLTTMLVVLFFHTQFNRAFVVFGILTFLAGYLVEVAGVHTGQIFGSYVYGSALGYQVWEVPLLIGCNWFTLIYCTGIIAGKWIPNKWVRPIAGATLMVFLDYFIEPVAIRNQFWSWHGGVIPVQNYIAWFVVSFLLMLLFFGLPFRKENKIAPAVYLIQLLFFAAHLIN